MNTSSIIRTATPEDAAAVAAIYNASIDAGDATMQRAPLTAGDVCGWLDGFSDREVLLVLTDGATVLGWGVVKRYSDREGYRLTCETSVYLRRDRTGHGLGSQMQDALLGRCRAFGYHHVVAKIHADNAPSLALHKKFGFELVGVQREVGYIDGRWVDVAIMQRLL